MGLQNILKTKAQNIYFTDKLQDIVDIINNSECSLKITLRTVQLWAENGTIEKNAEGLYDVALILEQRFTKGLSEEKVKWQRESAKKLELANAETEKKLIPRYVAEKVFYEAGSRLKSIFLPSIKKIASAIKGETDNFVVEQIIKQIIEECFKVLEKNFEMFDFKEDVEEEEDN